MDVIKYLNDAELYILFCLSMSEKAFAQILAQTKSKLEPPIYSAKKIQTITKLKTEVITRNALYFLYRLNLVARIKVDHSFSYQTTEEGKKIVEKILADKEKKDSLLKIFNASRQKFPTS